MTAQLKPFPWQTLTPLRAVDLDVERRAKKGVERLLDLDRLPAVLHELFVAQLEDCGVTATRVTAERRDLGAQFMLRGAGLVVWLSVEPALVALLIQRLLGQAFRLDSGAGLSPSMTGAAFAIVTEVGRRLSKGPPLAADFSLAPTGSGAAAPGATRAWACDVWLRLDGASYRAFAALSTEPAALADDTALPNGAGSGATCPIILPFVAAQVVVDQEQFQSLSHGDVLVPDEPTLQWTQEVAAGQPVPDGISGLLCAPGAPSGLSVCTQGGNLCFAGVVQVSYDLAVDNKNNRAAADAAPGPTAADVIMDAPVVVHIELGSVTLSAQSWLGIRPGDVVSTELPIGRPVTLRVAEQVVAEGELVSVDGRVGVRVLRFMKG